MQRRLVQIFTLYIGVGPRDLYIDKAHTALDIFRIAVFFWMILMNFLKPTLYSCQKPITFMEEDGLIKNQLFFEFEKNRIFQE